MSALPTTPDEIDAGWLSEALAERFPGVAVSELVVEDAQLGTNTNARLRIRYAGRTDAPASMWLKLPPSEPVQRRLVRGSGMGRREVGFYSVLADAVPLRVPAAYAALWDDETGGFALLIEDLAASGCSFPDGLQGISLAHAERAMDDFAALHARFAVQADQGLDLSWVEPPIRMPEYGAGMLQHALDTRRGELPGAFAELAALYIEANEEVHGAWERGDWTLCHGDGHATNLFDDAGRPGFFDWGCFSWAPGMRDVGYFLCMSLDIALRREHERALIQRYLRALAAEGATAPGFEDAWAQHRLQASYTVPGSAPAVIHRGGRVSEQARYARAFADRSFAAVEDLDALGALREALATR